MSWIILTYKSDVLDGITNATGNGTQALWNSVKAVAHDPDGISEIIVLACGIVLAILVLLIEYLMTRITVNSQNSIADNTAMPRSVQWPSIAISISATLEGAAIAIYVLYRYFHLTNTMRVEDLLQIEIDTTPTLS
jgi:hypothetical protein